MPPLPVSIEIRGETLDLTPLRVGELPAFVRAIRPFAEQLTTAIDWLGICADHGESLLEAVALASRRPRLWVDGLALDEAIRLAEALLEVNADFFVRRVSPEIDRVARRLAARTHAIVGAMPSSASSPPATATPRS
ncbi:MAG: hypothetical protein HT579_04235 [Candidatus Accumulibacter similis]|nr:MAG: hypothetical protein HT579_04235 [Candidatus Accumulibacter similis]